MFYISLSYICIYIDVLNRIDDVKYNFDNLNIFSRAFARASQPAGMPKKDKELSLSFPGFHFFLHQKIKAVNFPF